MGEGEDEAGNEVAGDGAVNAKQIEQRFELIGCQPGCRHYGGERRAERVLNAATIRAHVPWLGCDLGYGYGEFIVVEYHPVCALSELCAERRSKLLIEANMARDAALASGKTYRSAFKAWERKWAEYTEQPCPFYERAAEAPMKRVARQNGLFDQLVLPLGDIVAEVAA